MFLFLTIISLTQSAEYFFNGTSVTTTPSPSPAAVHSISNNSCFKLVSRNLHLYHLSSEGVLQSWPKSNLALTTLNASVLPSAKIHDFGVDSAETRLVFVTSDVNSA